MSEENPNYETYSQFGEERDSPTIPHISSFAKRNDRLSTSRDLEEGSQSTGFYRELTLEQIDRNGSMPNINQTSTTPVTMRSHQQQQQQQQEQQQPGTEQQYAKAVAAAVAAAYEAQAQAQEMGRIAGASMVSTAGAVGTAGGSSGPIITSVSGIAVHPRPPSSMAAASATNPTSLPPLLPMQLANSSLLSQALQAAGDMGGLPALQLAVQQQQQLQQQQQQLLHAVQVAQAQNAGQRMMSPPPSAASPTGGNESKGSDQSSLLGLMHPSSIVRHGDPCTMRTPTHISQLQTPNSSQLLTPPTSSPENTYNGGMPAAAATLPSINMSAEMMPNSNQASSLNMGLSPHFVHLNSIPGAPSPMSPMVIQSPGPNGQQEMGSPEHHMMAQGIPPAGITNNNIDMMSNMPTQCTAYSAKIRNSKKPVPDMDKDGKYFERRSRNNMAAKRSRDTRKQREDQVSMRANFLQKENDILRAQLATLRQEANSLKQLLTQQRPIMPAQQMPMQMHAQMMPKNDMPR